VRQNRCVTAEHRGLSALRLFRHTSSSDRALKVVLGATVLAVVVTVAAFSRAWWRSNMQSELLQSLGSKGLTAYHASRLREAREP
jgi:hypothetical protein